MKTKPQRGTQKRKARSAKAAPKSLLSRHPTDTPADRQEDTTFDPGSAEVPFEFGDFPEPMVSVGHALAAVFFPGARVLGRAGPWVMVKEISESGGRVTYGIIARGVRSGWSIHRQNLQSQEIAIREAEVLATHKNITACYEQARTLDPYDTRARQPFSHRVSSSRRLAAEFYGPQSR